MSKLLPWVLGNQSLESLNSFIRPNLIGAVPTKGNSTINGDIDIQGNLSISGNVSGSPLGVYRCDTNSATNIKEITTDADFSGNQNVILVYFSHQNTYRGELKIKIPNGSVFTLYIKNNISSATNYGVSEGLHLLSFSDGKAFLDYLIPNRPASYPTSVTWDGLKIKISGVNMTTITTTANIQSAAADTAGIVTTGTQTFGGQKTFSGVVLISNDSTATNTATGALRVTGGVGIKGSCYVGVAVSTPILTVSGSTASTSTSTGALKVTGGVGIGGSCYVGGTVVANQLTVNSTSTFNNTVSGKSSSWSGNLTVSGITTLSGQLKGSTATFTGAVSAVSYTATSSREVKTDIYDFTENATDIINSVNVVKFKYKTDLNHQKIGFIAEDTHPLLSSESQKKFDIGNSIGLLLKSVQELSNRLSEVEKWKSETKK